MSQKPDLAALFGATDASSFLGREACEDLDAPAASLALVGAPCATPYVIIRDETATSQDGADE